LYDKNVSAPIPSILMSKIAFLALLRFRLDTVVPVGVASTLR